MTQPLPPSMLHVLHAQAARLGDRPALWSKRAGYYLPLSWRELASAVRHFALGLRRLGFGKGDALLLCSSNREEWVVAFLAGMALGGLPVGWPTSADRSSLPNALRRFSAKVAVVDHGAAVAAPGEGSKLAAVVSMDLRGATEGGQVTFAEVLQSGMGRDEGPYWESVNGLLPEHAAMVACTSGATAAPKAVVLSHRNLVWTSRRLMEASAVEDGDAVLCHQPLAHMSEQLVSLHLALAAGLQVYFAQGDRPLWDELHETRPHVFHAPPRTYQKLLWHVEKLVQRGSGARHTAAAWAREVTLRRHLLAIGHERVPPQLIAQYELAKRGVLQRLKEEVGLQRAKVLLAGGEPVDCLLLEAFLSLDLHVIDVYGSTEATGLVSLGTPEGTKLGACGRPLLGSELKLSDGEILIRGPNLCLGLFDQGKVPSRDGWMCTGDAGQLDSEGFLRVSGRQEDLMATTGGKKVAPAAIEWMLKRMAPIEDAVVMRSSTGPLVAVVTLDVDRSALLAQQHGWPPDPERLSANRTFVDDLQRRIDAEINLRLSRWEAIRGVVVLPTELSVEGGDLTGTLQLKRRDLIRRSRAAVDALFA